MRWWWEIVSANVARLDPTTKATRAYSSRRTFMVTLDDLVELAADEPDEIGRSSSSKYEMASTRSSAKGDQRVSVPRSPSVAKARLTWIGDFCFVAIVVPIWYGVISSLG